MSHEGDEVYVVTIYDPDKDWMVEIMIIAAPRIFSTFEGAKADAKSYFEAVATCKAYGEPVPEMTWTYFGNGIHEFKHDPWNVRFRVTAVIVGD